MPAPEGITRLVGQAIAVDDLEHAVDDYERFGFELSDRSRQDDWGVDTATFGFRDGGFLELATPLDTDRPAGAAMSAYLHEHGPGVYLATLEVADVHEAHTRLVERGVDVAGPPVRAPVRRDVECDLLWVRPRSTNGAFVQLMSQRGGRHIESTVADGIAGWFNAAIAVADVEAGIAAFERLGMTLADRSRRADWGLDTATFHCAETGSVELVCPTDAARPAAAAIVDFLGGRRGGHYMPVVEVDDVDELHDRLVERGVPVLGPPTPTPRESPWPPARQMWIHPKAAHGAFLEFLSVED